MCVWFNVETRLNLIGLVKFFGFWAPGRGVFSSPPPGKRISTKEKHHFWSWDKILHAFGYILRGFFAYISSILKFLHFQAKNHYYWPTTILYTLNKNWDFLFDFIPKTMIYVRKNRKMKSFQKLERLGKFISKLFKILKINQESDSSKNC